MAPAAAVQVVGLRALFRDLNRMADPRAGDLIAAMKEAGRAAATPVADAVRAAYTKGSRSPNSGKLAGSVRISATRTGAAVRAGSKKVNWAGPVDFGGWPRASSESAGWRASAGGFSHRVTGAHLEGGRPFLPDGRYMYPAMRTHQAAAVAKYEAAIGRTVTKYAWTNTGANPHD